MPGADQTFVERYGAWAVVAGASDGVGAAYARAVAERGLNVVLIARREELLNALAKEIRSTWNVEAHAVSIDLAAPGAGAQVMDIADGLEVGMLMYNAGADPMYEHFLSYDVGPQLAMIQRNCVVPTQLCHYFGRAMVERGRGGIVLVCSSAGTIGMPRMVAYGGTKAFDLVFAEALWSELHADGVDVLAPILAATDTPALRRLLTKRGVLTSEDDDAELPDAVTPEEVVEGIIANLAEGPSWYAGESSRRGGEGLRKMSRNDAVRAVLKQTSVYKD
jgi:short-subunit dehydrogenase